MKEIAWIGNGICHTVAPLSKILDKHIWHFATCRTVEFKIHSLNPRQYAGVEIYKDFILCPFRIHFEEINTCNIVPIEKCLESLTFNFSGGYFCKMRMKLGRGKHTIAARIVRISEELTAAIVCGYRDG
jgi:hypothetical protein